MPSDVLPEEPLACSTGGRSGGQGEGRQRKALMVCDILTVPHPPWCTHCSSLVKLPHRWRASNIALSSAYVSIPSLSLPLSRFRQLILLPPIQCPKCSDLCHGRNISLPLLLSSSICPDGLVPQFDVPASLCTCSATWGAVHNHDSFAKVRASWPVLPPAPPPAPPNHHHHHTHVHTFPLFPIRFP